MERNDLWLNVKGNYDTLDIYIYILCIIHVGYMKNDIFYKFYTICKLLEDYQLCCQVVLPSYIQKK